MSRSFWSKSSERPGSPPRPQTCALCQAPTRCSMCRTRQGLNRARRASSLFDDESKKFFLSCAEEKFARLPEIDLSFHVHDALPVDFDPALFDQPLGLAARGGDVQLNEQCR